VDIFAIFFSFVLDIVFLATITYKTVILPKGMIFLPIKKLAPATIAVYEKKP